MRVFIAIELSAEVQEELRRVQDQLKPAGADVKWVEPEDIHLTLKFLGDVSLELIAEVKKQLDALVKVHQRFELTIGGVGAFPKVEYPRVIWVGAERGAEQTVELANSLEEKLLNFGFLKEKRQLKPHLTLGRVRSSQNRNQLRELLQSVTVQPKTSQVETVVLFESTLTSQGAIYKALHKVKLS
ncbi:MAG: RNA 2',3'-cyclic phosphodiesterase [Candidatus Omnitrophica bacterium]|nr:RNA 2',3'-cyclic phosphodiesterase [Candidatus Omnitrophota bacterium]